MPRTIAFLNRKGGTAKTSTVHHLGGTLAARGLRVLLVDADPQASLTQGLLGPEEAEALDPRETIASILDESGTVRYRDLVRPTAFANLALLAGSEGAERFNHPEPWALGAIQFGLRDALEEAGEGFDLVLIDCPPHVQLWSWSALVAADGVVVPVQAEDYGSQGMRSIARAFERVRAEANPRLALVGYLVSMFQKSLSVHATYEAMFRERHGADVFGVMVPHIKDFKEAVTFRKPIAAYKPRSAAAKAMGALADEFMARLDDRLGTAGGGA